MSLNVFKYSVDNGHFIFSRMVDFRAWVQFKRKHWAALIAYGGSNPSKVSFYLKLG